MKNIRIAKFHLSLAALGLVKTTVAKRGLAFTGTIMQQFWSQGTKKKYIQLCCSGCLPLLINNPKSKQAISDFAIALFNGITEGTLTRDQAKPFCMAVLTANFTVSEKEN